MQGTPLFLYVVMTSWALYGACRSRQGAGARGEGDGGKGESGRAVGAGGRG